MNEPSFETALQCSGVDGLRRGSVTTLQINVGKLCNQACLHCHVEAGPGRKEVMSAPIVARVLEVLDGSPRVETVDITGGAPELNPGFREIVQHARSRGRTVIDRCNLTVLLEPGMEWLAAFLADHGVHLICSLPCYTAENVDMQRGAGVFERSIDALRRLNDLGYGMPDSPLSLDLVYNPTGAFLPPAPAELEPRYHEELRRMFGVEFDELLTITNMPIKRFADQLRGQGQHASYMRLLVESYNPATLAGLMCRSLVSVGWEGSLYDCDFNQMVDAPVRLDGERATIDTIASLDELEGLAISTGSHCFGCTAGRGSSCNGAPSG